MRRHFYVTGILNALGAGIFIVMCVAATLPWLRPEQARALWSATSLWIVGWMLLTVLSTRTIRAAHRTAALVAAGRLDLAEDQLKAAMRLFSIYTGGKLAVCHNLAVIAHGQKDFAAAAELCDGILALRGGVSRALGRLCRLLLADCRLILGDTAAALRAIEPLSMLAGGLSLPEQLMLLPIELRCQLAQGRHREAADGLEAKVRLAELMDSPRAALAHALLAQACRESGRAREADFLLRRAELYHDLDRLRQEFSVLPDPAA
jgi:hypothetical protein